MIYKSNKIRKIKGLFLACRPKQFLKNLIVFLSPIFAFSFEPYIWLNSLKAFISFSLVASSIYLINDSIDKNKDRKHPIKKYRSIASGLISVNSAIKLSIILLFTSLIIGFQLNNAFVYILISYFITQILYSFCLKHIPIIELFCVASGFVLRSISGGIASNIFISRWFFLAIGMLSLFLAVEKRKAEILNFKNNNIEITRKVLNIYTLPLINKFESILSSCTIMTYSLWAYGPIIGGSKSSLMIITIPLVILGIFRYQLLSETNMYETKDKLKISILESPENVILYDNPMKIILSTWLFTIIYIGLNS